MTQRDPGPPRRPDPDAVGRHRVPRARTVRRGRVAALAASLLVTLVVVVLSAVRPSPEERVATEDTASTWGTEATLPTVTPSPSPSPSPSGTSSAARRSAEVEPTTFPQSGAGTFRTAAVVDVAGSGGGRDRTYTVEVEKGLLQDRATFARDVARVLGHERGWRTDGWSFTQVARNPDVRVMLASPDTVDRLCAPLLTRGEVSCRSGDRVVLNVKRWVRGVTYYGDDLTGYRTYLVNHEVGHALGKYHVGCPAPGAKAPVMLQQSKGLQGCVKNPWP
ncbi:DUF3152 domain-containing protein [Aeromicrobium sp.]|uniref:DUF3152 domain-containing protein n=1 Tax=Aeromicrobium sp. TaxID=1871063 RepID=UPI0035131AEB